MNDGPGPLDPHRDPHASGPAEAASHADSKKPLTKRVWFRAGCALAPFVAILLVISAGGTTGPTPETSTTAPSSQTRSTTPAQSAASTTTTLLAGDTAGTDGIAAPGPPKGASPTGALDSTSARTVSNDTPGNPAGVSAWAAAHSQLLRQLRTDVVNVAADVTNGELSSLPGDCAGLQLGVQAAQSVTPPPDATAASLWTETLSMFGLALTQCTTGIAQHDASAIAEAAAETSAGGTTLASLTKG